MIKKAIVRVLMILTIFSIVALSGCSPKVQKRYTADFLELFNTVTRVIGYADSEEGFKEESQFIYDRLAFYHQQYNSFESFEGVSNIRTINNQAGIGPVKVDPAIIDLLELSKSAYEETGGKVNVMMGSVTGVWHEYRERYLYDSENSKLPPLERLQEAARHTGIDSLLIDRAEGTVYISDKEAKLDVGAIAKGYAVQRVVEEARARGMDHLLLSVGGNVASIGSKFDEKGKKEKWSVGVQNPNTQSDQEITPSLKLEDICLVSSGDYERYYVYKGEMYAHIIDPETLFPPTQFHQVSILAKDSGLADIYSTAVFIMDLEEGMAFVKAKGVEAMWVLQDGSVVYSEGFRGYEKP